MRTIRVTFSNGDHIVTGINGNNEEIRQYYIGQIFNIGQGEHDLLTTAVSVEFLDTKEAA